MKKNYSLILILSFTLIFISGFNSVNAQVIAGSIPSTGFSINPNLNFTVVNIMDDTTGTIDLNCDNIPDLTIQLVKGQTSIDGANSVYLYVNNPIYQICADTTSGSIRTVKYFNLGDTLNCNGGFALSSDTVYHLGEYGCLGCVGPWTVFGKYFAFDDGNRTGWIKISFDLIDGGGSIPISLSINEMMIYCTTNSINEFEKNNSLSIMPNPTADGILTFQGNVEVKSVEVFNSVGQKVESKFYDTTLILPNEKGIYIVRIKDESGTVANRTVIRN